MAKSSLNMFVQLLAEVVEPEELGLVQVQAEVQDERGLRSHCQEICWKQMDQQRALMKQWQLVMPFDIAQQEIYKCFGIDQITCCLGVDIAWPYHLGSSERYCDKFHIFECEQSRSYHSHHSSIRVLMTKQNMNFSFRIDEAVSAPAGGFWLLARPPFMKIWTFSIFSLFAV